MIIFRNPYINITNKEKIDTSNQIQFKVDDIIVSCSKTFPKIQEILNQYLSDKDTYPQINLFKQHILKECQNDYISKIKSKNDFFSESNSLINSLSKYNISYNYSIVIKQLSLLLNGYDIIITDFLISYFYQIADIFELTELHEALDHFNEEINDYENYERFSELELLEEFNNILYTINKSNFNEKISLIFSLSEYLGNDIFNSIISYFIALYPTKETIYSQLISSIKSKKSLHKTESKYSPPKILMKFPLYQPKSYFCSNKSSLSNIISLNSIKKEIIDMIKIDDVNSLQKYVNQPQFNQSENTIKSNQPKRNNHHIDNNVILDNYIDILNYIYEDDDDDDFEFDLFYSNSNNKPKEIIKYSDLFDHAAFYGSLKCFKFLLLNSEDHSQQLAKYAVAGGNTEIIHICEQNKKSFEGTLKVAIYYHQNDIAQWIFENEKDMNNNYFIYWCIDANNFELLHYFLDLRSETTLNLDQIITRYILYVNQYFHFLKFSNEVNNYLFQYPIINRKNELVYCSKTKVELVSYFLSRKNDNSHIRCVLYYYIFSFLFI